MRFERIAATLCLAVGLSVTATAQSTDYSRTALFEIFVEPPAPVIPGLSVDGAAIEYRRGSTILRFLPLLLPLPMTAPSHTPMPAVDPFALTRTQFPDTRETISRLNNRQETYELSLKEQWNLWRTRREVESYLRAVPK